VRNKLHQVGGAYFRQQTDYNKALADLSNTPDQLHSDSVKSTCIQLMKAHASTAERLPILETFFSTCLASITPVRSIVDLACGLNPLAIPWMPLAKDFQYQACDIYIDMMGFIQKFFDHFNLDGKAAPCDILGKDMHEPTQVAFLLKSIPCLEQIDKSVGSRVLERIQAQNILVSFPVSSLAGQRKGMPAFYKDHFYDLVESKQWKIQEFTFPTELAFLVTK